MKEDRNHQYPVGNNTVELVTTVLQPEGWNAPDNSERYVIYVPHTSLLFVEISDYVIWSFCDECKFNAV